MARKDQRKGRSKDRKKASRMLGDEELTGVSGGQWKLTNPSIPGSNVRSRPGYTGPTVSGPSGSIAQGDTLDNTLTQDRLP